MLLALAAYVPPACAQDLKARTRIFVPRSALLMGVMDEEGVLEYGEVSRACALLHAAPGAYPFALCAHICRKTVAVGRLRQGKGAQWTGQHHISGHMRESSMSEVLRTDIQPDLARCSWR